MTTTIGHRPGDQGEEVPKPRVEFSKLIDPKTRGHEIDPAAYTPNGSNGNGTNGNGTKTPAAEAKPRKTAARRKSATSRRS